MQMVDIAILRDSPKFFDSALICCFPNFMLKVLINHTSNDLLQVDYFFKFYSLRQTNIELSKKDIEW